jgi:hypothetical protein
LLPHIERWVNQSVSESTGYAPIELMEGKPKPDLFRNVLTKHLDQLPQEESGHEKAVQAYLRMKLKAEKRNRRRKVRKHRWEPRVDDLVLAKRQATADAFSGISSKFIHPYAGPFRISKIIPPAMYELVELNGKMRGVFQKDALKAYQQDD